VKQELALFKRGTFSFHSRQAIEYDILRNGKKSRRKNRMKGDRREVMKIINK
jgi:hypothetical protein